MASVATSPVGIWTCWSEDPELRQVLTHWSERWGVVDAWPTYALYLASTRQGSLSRQRTADVWETLRPWQNVYARCQRASNAERLHDVASTPATVLATQTALRWAPQRQQAWQEMHRHCFEHHLRWMRWTCDAPRTRRAAAWRVCRDASSTMGWVFHLAGVGASHVWVTAWQTLLSSALSLPPSTVDEHVGWVLRAVEQQVLWDADARRPVNEQAEGVPA